MNLWLIWSYSYIFLPIGNNIILGKTNFGLSICVQILVWFWASITHLLRCVLESQITYERPASLRLWLRDLDEMNIRFYNEALWLFNLFLALDSSSNLLSFFYEGLFFSSVWEIASNIICFSSHDSIGWSLDGSGTIYNCY